MTGVGAEIVRVRTEAEAGEARVLARVFKAWNYAYMPDLMPRLDEYFASQNFERDLANILTLYNPPDGECLLARWNGKPVGILMLKRRSATEAEMNRMFVTEAARGQGIARALAATLIERARALGYQAILLNVLDRLNEAASLYRSLGFLEDARIDHPDIVEEINLRLDLN